MRIQGLAWMGAAFQMCAGGPANSRCAAPTPSLLIAGCCFLLCAFAASAQPRTVHIEEMTWPEVRDAIASGTTAALYYAGGTEQNGPHMVLGKHGLIARHVAERIALRLGNALVYPVLPYALRTLLPQR